MPTAIQAACGSGNTNTYLTKVTDALAHSTSFTYGYSDGQVDEFDRPE